MAHAYTVSAVFSLQTVDVGLAFMLLFTPGY